MLCDRDERTVPVHDTFISINTALMSQILEDLLGMTTWREEHYAKQYVKGKCNE